MSPYAFFPLVCFLTFLALGLFVLFHRPRSNIKIVFSLLCFEAFYWQVVWFVSFFTGDRSYLDYLAKISYTAISFLPFTFYHFIVSYLKLKSEKKSVVAFYCIGLAMVILLPTDLFVRGHRSFAWGNFAAPGPLYPVFMFSALITMTRGIYLLSKAHKKPSSYGISRNQLRYIFLGLALYYLCAVDFSQVYGVPWYPIGVFFFLSSFFVISYAILRHRLMDIEVVIKRTLVFAGIFAFFFGIFAFLSFLVTDVLQRATTGTVRLWIFAVGAAITALVVNRLHTFLVNVTDRFLFQKKYNFYKLLKENSKQLAFIHSLDELAKQIVAFLVKQGRIKNAAIFVQSEEGNSYMLKFPLGYGGRTKRPDFSLDGNHPLIRLLEGSKSPLQTEDLENKLKQVRGVGGSAARAYHEALNVLRQLKAEVAIPSFLGNPSEDSPNQSVVNLRNILILGPKKSDQPYSEEDLDVFFTIAQDSAIAAENARLFDAVLRERESKLKAQSEAKMVGYARTIGHEIKNALVGIEGPAVFLQRHQVPDLKEMFERFMKEKAPAGAQNKYLDICGKIESQGRDIYSRVQKIRVIASTAQGTLKASDDSFQEIYFKILWENAKEECPLSDCQYITHIPENFVIYGNVVLLQRVFINLIGNALEAMVHQKEKKVELKCAYAEIDSKKYAHFEFSDNGPGIPEAILPKIFEQGFSTKSKPRTADIQASGHGHGLYICKEVVESIHNGKIGVQSSVGKGTTFFIRLPLPQESKEMKSG